MTSAALGLSFKVKRCVRTMQILLSGVMDLVAAVSLSTANEAARDSHCLLVVGIGLWSVRARKSVSTIKRCFRENWGAPFIIGFMLLLMVAAASLSVGLDPLANGVAVYAYCALAIGVVLQLVRLLKNGKKDSCEDR